jgi:diguanylate cyclase (GGDEF)-like protein
MTLHLPTLLLILTGTTASSTLVLFIMWRINRGQSAIALWLMAYFAGVISLSIMYVESWVGLPPGVNAMLSNSLSLTATLFMLEGVLRFRGWHSRRRWHLFLALIPVFIFASWLNRLDAVPRYQFHDTVCFLLSISAMVAFQWQLNSRQDRMAYLLATFSLGWMAVNYLLRAGFAFSGNLSLINGMDSGISHAYYFSGLLASLNWVFGLVIACYYRANQENALLARQDPLTGLHNRRSIDESLSRCLNDQGRGKGDFAIILLDLDDFKSVNDRFGHLIGDQLLVDTAQRLKNSVREGDIAGRLGGDEFIVIARYIDDEEALGTLMTRLSRSLNRDFEHQPGKRFSTTMSMGAAVCPGDGLTADHLLSVADVRMYRNKSAFYDEGQLNKKASA